MVTEGNVEFESISMAAEDWSYYHGDKLAHCHDKFKNTYF